MKWYDFTNMMNQIDLSRTDLNLLVLFEAVFEANHVGRAADRLNLSSSAVSHGLGRLRRLFNDPLFLKTPKGVVPTDRARSVAPAIDEVLRGARAIVASVEPFDPATSSRRFVIGAPDGVSAVFLERLLAGLATDAPGIDLGICQLLPVAGEVEPERAWSSTFNDLDRRTIDVAVIPSDRTPARFAKRMLYEEDFVIAMRPGHAFARNGTMAAYCGSQHLVVSVSGDAHGFVDEALARLGLSRRVALTVPNFMFACAVIATSDFLCALPRRFAELHAGTYGLCLREPPVAFSHFNLNAVAPKPALMDDGIAWLIDKLEAATHRD